MKVKTIKLSDGWRDLKTRADMWQVEQLTDSLEFSIGDRLSREVVESLISSVEWKVTIVANKKRA